MPARKEDHMIDDTSRLLTDEEAESLLRKRIAGAKRRELAAEFGISESTVGGICKGRIYRHLNPLLREQCAAVCTPRGTGDLSPADVRIMRWRRKRKGESYEAIGRDYGKSRSVAFRIINGASYANVD